MKLTLLKHTLIIALSMATVFAVIKIVPEITTLQFMGLTLVYILFCGFTGMIHGMVNAIREESSHG